jgi:starch phosphorylase
MKFMMNGALTVGTRDGANIEIAEEAGQENAFMFGLTTDQVLGGRGWYSPQWHYENEPETRAALDLIFGNHFCPEEPGAFEPIRETLLTKGDYYMHLADLTGYVETQQMVSAVYKDRHAWAKKAIHNVARSGKFSSDRTIFEYCRDVWKAGPCRPD